MGNFAKLNAIFRCCICLRQKLYSKSCKLFLNAHFVENKFSKKLPLGLCRLVLSRL